MPKIFYLKRPIKKTKINTDIKYDLPIKKSVEKKLNKELTIKSKKNTVSILILRKNGSALLIGVPTTCKSFSVEGNTYFNVKSGCYLMRRRNIISVYLEGVVLPLEHKYITYQKHEVLLTDRMGNPVKEITEEIGRNDIVDLPKNDKGYYLKNNKGYIIKKVLNRIKGLEFDSIIADAIYSSGLIEKVSKGGRPNKLLFWLFLFIIINVVISTVAVIVHYT